jgi:hypothetical protein
MVDEFRERTNMWEWGNSWRGFRRADVTRLLHAVSGSCRRCQDEKEKTDEPETPWPVFPAESEHPRRLNLNYC